MESAVRSRRPTATGEAGVPERRNGVEKRASAPRLTRIPGRDTAALAARSNKGNKGVSAA